MKVAVLSGKGGAGKTLVATGLACAAGRAVYIDCDVEEPNGRLFLKPENTVSRPVTKKMPAFDREKCTGCRKCVEHCRFNALVLVKGAPMLFDEVCHSCGVCAYVCPEGAVSETEREVGAVETGMSGEIKVATGELKLGEATGVPVIAAALAEAEPEDGLTVIDCPPGSACPVMESAREADYCVLVTEPTAFGLHDLRLVVELMRVLKKPCGVVINKAGAEYPELERYLEAEGMPVLARIPYSERLAAAGARGALAYREDGEARSIFDALLSRIRKEARA